MKYVSLTLGVLSLSIAFAAATPKKNDVGDDDRVDLRDDHLARNRCHTGYLTGEPVSSIGHASLAIYGIDH